MLLLPLARREGWIGWVGAVASFLLIAPFVMLIIVGVFDRIRDAVRIKPDGRKSNDDNGHGSG